MLINSNLYQFLFSFGSPFFFSFFFPLFLSFPPFSYSTPRLAGVRTNTNIRKPTSFFSEILDCVDRFISRWNALRSLSISIRAWIFGCGDRLLELEGRSEVGVKVCAFMRRWHGMGIAVLLEFRKVPLPLELQLFSTSFLFD